ncbi:cilia- and flagella-associated protein 45 [Acanthochromis polyacanthus]|uniref:Cilia- and flagella-associated protein 45 n=1 Tax=Acanthochromis polyacanthus TaxID=80966 RepID=A0A3Q1EWZ4_9TELE|nr:cilia- and flagella-associated protein 45 [Acanthochromis polyacanthus]
MSSQRLSSGSTTSRARSFPGRYRTLAPSARVDETLFGVPSPLDRREDPDSRTKNWSQKKKEGETIQIITKDLIRSLRIPRHDPSGEFMILPAAKLERTPMSRCLDKAERKALKQAYQEKKEEELKAAEERKHRIYKADQSHKENQALTELELEARDRAQRLLERANALRMEQEDEIKKLNQLIQGAQCQAIRDAQMQEKKQVEAEMAEEEKRLDIMMEVERRKALETVERIDELRKQQRIRGMQQIYDQIKQHLEEKQVEDEIKEQEGQQIREKQERMNLEDLEALEKKKMEQQLLQEEIMRINAETMRAKEQRKEEEKLATLRAMEYIKNKQQREAEYEAEQKRIKKDKELEIARLRAQQEKAKDCKAEQDELRARRNQEIADREWRRKEKELAVKKAQEEEMLREAHLEQVHRKEHCLSIEAAREKAEFERVLKAQQEAIAKQKEKEERQHQKAHRHAQAVRQQIRERELSAITKRSDIFKEADQLIEEARQRRVRLDEIKRKKLQELKATGLPEKYVSEVERKAQINKL